MNFTTFQNIQDEIIRKSNEDYSRFLEFLKQNKNPDINAFIEKYIDWHINFPVRNYVMFKEVIPQDTNSIFAELHSFVGNYFLDDSYFSVKWYTNEYIDGELFKEPCKKVDMFAEPSVEYDDDYGTQNPKEILDAMVQYEKNEQARMDLEWIILMA